MERIWLKEWFGIKFREFAKLNENELAGSKFYEMFYQRFHQRYSSFEELPDNWKIQKKQVAIDINTHAKLKKTILSIGCGIGYIEKILFEMRGGGIIAIEPSASAARWLKDIIEVRNGYFPHVILGQQFDLAYASVIDYSMSDSDYLCFLRKMHDSRIPEFMLVNLLTGRKYWNSQSHLKELLKSALSFLKIRPRGQFWGYLRSLEEQITFLKKAGYQNIMIGQHGNLDTYWLKAIR